MKLLFAVVHDEDAAEVVDELNLFGFSVTRLFSSGGFLRHGNTTLLIGTEEEHIDTVVELIGKNSKERSHKMNPAAAGAVQGALPVNNARAVVSGGATIFVVDVYRFEKF